MFSETLQFLTGFGALILGLGYVFGGLIVNVHLAQYGITEYQVVRVKYLVVGLIYLFTILMLSIATLMLVVILVIVQSILTNGTPNSFILMYVGETLVSLAASLILLGYWLSRKTLQEREKRGSQPWRWFSWLTIVSLLQPITVLAQQVFVASQPGLKNLPNTDYSPTLVAAAILAILAFISQVYFYARYMYGNPKASAWDPIGMGIPSKVQLASAADNITLLSHMGILSEQPDLTQAVWLIDETDENYIIGIGELMTVGVIKIDKALVKGIVYSKSSGVNISNGKT